MSNAQTTLRELLSSLAQLDDELTIYSTESPTPDSPAIAKVEPESGELRDEATGLVYLVEVFLAKEVAAVWRDWRDGREPTPDELCEAVVFYAERDAYLPIDSTARPASLDPDQVPKDLHPLIPLAEVFGISDDPARERLVLRTPPEEMKRARATVLNYEDELDDWLAGPESTAEEPTEEYVAFSALRMAVDFA